MDDSSQRRRIIVARFSRSRDRHAIKLHRPLCKYWQIETGMHTCRDSGNRDTDANYQTDIIEHRHRQTDYGSTGILCRLFSAACNYTIFAGKKRHMFKQAEIDWQRQARQKERQTQTDGVTEVEKEESRIEDQRERERDRDQGRREGELKVYRHRNRGLANTSSADA